MANQLNIAVTTYRPEPGLIEPFVGPRLKVKRARAHLRELTSTLSSYGKTAKAKWNRWYEPSYEHMAAWWLVWQPEPPAMVPLIVGDVVHNLRAALDILICDIARHRGKGLSDLKFPFADTESAWETSVLGLMRLGPDVVAAVREMGAYRNGPSSGLRALHDFDILDKHRLIVPVYSAVWAEATLPVGLADDLISRREDGFVRLSSEDTLLIRHSLERTHLPRPKTEPVAYFSHGLPQGSPFAGHPVLEVLNNAANNVEAYVEAFSGQFGGSA